MSVETPIVDTWLAAVLGADATLASLAPCQQIGIVATGGTFTLTFNGQTTAPIAFNAPVIGIGSVQAALEALSTVGSKQTLVFNRAVAGWTVVFIGNLANTVLPITGNGAGLTGPGAALTISQQARVWPDVAPQLVPFPYLITQAQSAIDVIATGPYRVMVGTQYLVKGITQGQYYSPNLIAIANRIDSLLQAKAADSVTGGGRIVSCVRQRPFRLTEASNGVQYRQLGGIYEINVQA
jgi:hypothetical protein